MKLNWCKFWDSKISLSENNNNLHSPIAVHNTFLYRQHEESGPQISSRHSLHIQQDYWHIEQTAIKESQNNYQLLEIKFNSNIYDIIDKFVSCNIKRDNKNGVVNHQFILIQEICITANVVGHIPIVQVIWFHVMLVATCNLSSLFYQYSRK